MNQAVVTCGYVTTPGILT